MFKISLLSKSIKYGIKVLPKMLTFYIATSHGVDFWWCIEPIASF